MVNGNTGDSAVIGRSLYLILAIIFVALSLVITAGCVGDNPVTGEDEQQSEKAADETPAPSAGGEEQESVVSSQDDSVDYSDSYNWMSLPAVEKEMDVFYVYPTVSGNSSGSMLITDDVDRALAQGILEAQASVYEPSANVFAPYYRQMTTGVDMSGLPEGALATDTDEFKQGAADVSDAFDYYIENLNDGRPFMIAGHSQGTMALIELIKNRFGEDEGLRSRMVAAYLIGYTVTDDDLAKAGLTAAKGANDTGVVITYNTQSPTSVGGPMLMEGANCINPLNWKTDDTYAPASANIAARFYNDSTGEFLREVPNYSDAQIDLETGALTTTIPEGENLDIGSYPEGVYHRYDYAFWYRNLEQNVKDRVGAYLSQK